MMKADHVARHASQLVLVAFSRRRKTAGEIRTFCLATWRHKTKTNWMKATPPSRAPMPDDSFDERLQDVFSFREAIPVLEEYLSSVQIDEDNPGFLLDWQEVNVNAFVAAANRTDPAQAPQWLQTRPLFITTRSFMNDVVDTLEPEAGGRCGNVLLAPNNLEQFLAIAVTLCDLRNDAFMQDVMQEALPVVNNVEEHLAITYYLADSRVRRPKPNNLRPSHQDGIPLRRLFA